MVGRVRYFSVDQLVPSCDELSTSMARIVAELTWMRPKGMTKASPPGRSHCVTPDRVSIINILL
jgi:hypothetical protein